MNTPKGKNLIVSRLIYQNVVREMSRQNMRNLEIFILYLEQHDN